MQKTERIKITGVGYYPYLYPWAMGTGFDPQFNIELEMEEEDYKMLRAKGMKARKAENSGRVKFRRKNEAYRPEWGGPPTVFLKTNDGNIPFEQPVGNGSKVELTLDIYPYSAHGGGTGVRLVSVLVLDLVEYTGGMDTDGPTEEAVPETKEKEFEKQELDDDIPF